MACYKEDLIKTWSAVFHALDLNNSGYISYDEYKVHLNSVNVFNEKDIRNAFNLMGI